MKIRELKDHLPKKWRQKIQDVTGHTITYISYVVLGERPANTDAAKQIIQVALRLAENNKKEKEEFERRLNKMK